MTLRSTRSTLYRAARILGDINAVQHPRTIPKRIINKAIGRSFVSKLWRR